MKSTLYPNNLEECHAIIKQLRKDKNELNKKYECKAKELTYHKGLLYDVNRQNEFLKKRIEEERILHNKKIDDYERGYSVPNSFSPNHNGIYRIFNKTTGQSYVGQSSTNVYDRCMSHFESCDDSTDWHYDLTNNPENYEYEIIIEGVKNQGELDKLEIYNIGKYNCLENGYNKIIAAKYKFLGQIIK